MPWLSGDIFGFSGPVTQMQTLAIRLRDLTRFSHVALCCEYAGQVLLWESTTLCNVPCFICGKLHSGTQATDPETRVKNYHGSVYWMRLRDKLAPSEVQRLAYWLIREYGKPYDMKQCLWSIPSLHLYPSQGYDDSSWFCSEQVWAALQHVKRIPVDILAAAMRPAHVMRWLPRWGVYTAPQKIEQTCAT